MTNKKPSLRQLAKEAEANKQFDPTITAAQCLDDLLELQDQNPLETISRDFYRAHGKFAEATWTQHFGTFAQFKKKAGLEKSRLLKKLEGQIALHDSLDIFRKFYKEEVEEYGNKYAKTHKSKGLKTILIGSDFHDSDVDPFMMAIFIDTAKRLQPDIICLNGDVFDCYEFSRFYQDPRTSDIGKRMKFVKNNIFKPLRHVCPDAQIDLIMGNHEFRLLRHLSDKSPGMKVLLHDVMGISFGSLLGLDEFKINFVSKLDLAAYKVGDITSELKQNYKVYFDCYTASHEKDFGFATSGTSGHTHKPVLQTNTNIPLGKISWMTTGCMAKTEVEYVEGKNNYVNGFGLVHIDPEKKQVIQENIIVTGDFAAVAGKFYHRT